MTALRYSRTALRADFIRAGAGVALTIAPLTAIPILSVPGVILGGAGLLFAVFGSRTWLRSRSTVIVTEEGVAVNALFQRKIDWQHLTEVKLRYYSTRRDRSRGWMQLTLANGKKKISLESTLEKFEEVAEAAAQAARRQGIELSPSTEENLRALGIRCRTAAARPAVHPG